jgi:membrane fusion protein, multidrug efflux system
MPKKSCHVLSGGGLAAIAAAAILGCSREATPSQADSRPAVRVARPIVREITEYCYFTGRTEAAQSIDLQARVTGYLDSIDFTPGDEIKAGTQLFKIDPRPFQAKLDIAEAQVQLAEARHKLAEADLARAQELLRTPGVISQAEFDKYIAAETEAVANFAAAEANFNAAKLDVDYTSVVTMIEGVAGRNYPSVGDLIRQDDTLLTTVVTQDPMHAYFEVDEQTMLRVGRLIHEGKIKSRANGADIPVEMALADERDKFPHRGMMDFINNRISSSTGTREIRAVFENPLLSDGKTRMFTAGMFVRIRVPLGQPHDAMLIPEAAIGTDQGRKYVLVVNADDAVEQRLIELGPQEGEGLQVVTPVEGASTHPGEEVMPPLSVDDRIIVGGLQLVRPGAKVRIRNATPEAQE